MKVQGHRGVRYRPGIAESSLAALDAAIADGAHGVEWDVFLLEDGADGTLVVTHGEKELTNRDAFPDLDNDNPITDFHWQQLQHVQLRDHLGAPTSERLPTHEQALNHIAAYRKQAAQHPDIAERERAQHFVATIEIKHPPAGADPLYIDRAAQRVVESIKRRIGRDGWAQANFEVRSFSMPILEAVRKYLDAEGLPKVAIGALLAGEAGHGWDIRDLTTLDNKLADIAARDIRPDNISLTWQSFRVPGLGVAIDRFARDMGKPVHRNAWTSQEETLVTPQQRETFIATLVKQNIDTIITDDPGRVRREIDAYLNQNQGWAVGGP